MGGSDLWSNTLHVTTGKYIRTKQTADVSVFLMMALLLE